MCCSMQVYFTWKIPHTLMYFVCMALCVIFFFTNAKRPKNLNPRKPFYGLSKINVGLCAYISMCLIYNMLRNMDMSNIFLFFGVFMKIVTTCLLVFSTVAYKVYIFNKFDWLLKVICAVSLVAWIAYLFGYRWPGYYAEQNDYYEYKAYYLFLRSANTFELFPRFHGMFLEPGHIGSTSCLMLYLNRFNFSVKSNYIYLLSILFSLSLAAYSLLAIGLLLYYYFEGKQIIKKIGAVALMIYAVFLFGKNYNGGDNVIYEKIISRLEIDASGNIVGDNRTSFMFDSYYDKWLKDGDIVFGFGPDAYSVGGNLAIGTATYKRFFFINGLVGVVLVVLLYIFLLKLNFSRQGIGFSLLFLICNMIRDYPYRELWFYLFIMGVGFLYYDSRQRNSIKGKIYKKVIKQIK